LVSGLWVVAAPACSAVNIRELVGVLLWVSIIQRLEKAMPKSKNFPSRWAIALGLIFGSMIVSSGDETLLERLYKEHRYFDLRDAGVTMTDGSVGVIQREERGEAIPFGLDRNKTILSVQVGKIRPLKIILDSGMGWDGLLIFKPELRDSLGLLNPREATLGGAGSGNAQTALVSEGMSFLIGPKEFKNQRVVVLQNDHFRGFSNDGTVGYSLFGHYAVEIDNDRSRLTLHDPGEFRPDSSWTEIPIFFRDNNIPWLDVRIAIENEDPVQVACYIDYASSEAVELLLRPGQKFAVPKETEDAYLGRGLSGDINGRIGKIAKVIIGPHEITNVPTAFVAAEARSKQNGADGVIANNLLKRFNLIFDYARHKLYVKPNSHFFEPF
jgi:hypothetical protein